jgi:hypothetical protein
MFAIGHGGRVACRSNLLVGGESVTEAEVVAAFATLGQAYLAGVQTSFAIVSAYIVALYFFLGRAPIALRVLAFVFFSATLAVLGGYRLVPWRIVRGLRGRLGSCVESALCPHSAPSLHR